MKTPTSCTACGHKPTLSFGDPPLKIVGYTMPEGGVLRHHREYLCGSCWTCMNLAVHQFVTKSKETFMGVSA